MSTTTRMGSRPAHRRRSQAERSATTQRKIIKSAFRLLQNVGYQQTNLRDIALGAKMSLGALQHQFGNRQVLMERLVDEVVTPLAPVGTAWPEDAADLALEDRAREFVRLAWKRVYEPASYIAAWSLFFGCKTTPLFKRIDEHRKKLDPMFLTQFFEVFPEVSRNHLQPEHFAAVVFAALRGLAVMRLFKSDKEATEKELEVISQIIVQAGRS